MPTKPVAEVKPMNKDQVSSKSGKTNFFIKPIRIVRVVRVLKNHEADETTLNL